MKQQLSWHVSSLLCPSFIFFSFPFFFSRITRILYELHKIIPGHRPLFRPPPPIDGVVHLPALEDPYLHVAMDSRSGPVRGGGAQAKWPGYWHLPALWGPRRLEPHFLLLRVRSVHLELLSRGGRWKLVPHQLSRLICRTPDVPPVFSPH